MRLRNRTLPQAGTGANRDGESRPGPSSPGCPSYSGEGTVSHQTAQFDTVAVQQEQLSTCSSPTLSLFSSIPSSPPSYLNIHELSSNSSTSSLSHPAMDVVQNAISGDINAPILGRRRTRKTWTKNMNIFILRHYFILTDLEANTKTYLTPLHARFITEFPDMDVTKQRVGDQRRAIMQRNLLAKQDILKIKEEVRVLLQNQPSAIVKYHSKNTKPINRIRWSTSLNEIIMKSYYRLTKLETDLTTYRPLLHKDIISKCPAIAHLSVQRIADQRRSIVKNQLLSTDHLNRLREEIQNELDTTVTQSADITSQNTDDTLSTTQATQFNITEPIEHLSNEQNSEQTQETHNDLNLNTDLLQQLQELFTETFNRFNAFNPTERPYIPKQKPSKKFTSIIRLLNSFILPSTLTPDTDFSTLQTSIYSAAYTAAKFNGSRILGRHVINGKSRVLPWWQRRLEGRIKDLRANIGRVTEYSRGVRTSALEKHMNKIRQQHKVHSQHETENTDVNHFLDTLKQKLNTLTNRLRRYKETTIRKQQNKEFSNNERLFYRKLLTQQQNSQSKVNDTTSPTSESLHAFWSHIWSNTVEHKQNYWIEEDKERMKDVPEMEFENIHLDLLKKVIARTHNWKAAGSDNIHNFWYKKFTFTHSLLHKHINIFIHSPEIMPCYITEGITYMLPKDPSDLENPAKYRPITCLQNIYKIITSCLSESIYKHTQDNNILAEEQKGCRKNSQGCKEQLTIDAVATKQAIKLRSNIHTMYIDYKKAFDSVPHSWLLYILKHYKVHPTINYFLEKIMPNWNTKLKICNSNKTTETDFINIKRGIFQGDALSPLWFCLALNPLSHMLNARDIGFKIKHETTQTSLTHLMYMDDIKLFASSLNEAHTLADITQTFSNDICMEFGIDKCKIQSINKGIIEKTSYTLSNHDIIDSVDPVLGYKYLGYYQSQEIHHRDTKNILLENFKNRLRKILHTHLNARNTIKAINTFAIPILTYSFGIIRWTQTELKTLQRTINTTMTKNRKHHPRSCTQRLTLPKHEGGRGLIDILNLHGKQITLLRTFFHNRSHHSKLHNAICQADKFTPLSLADHTKQTYSTTLQQKIDTWTRKALHGRHRLDLTNPIVDKTASNAWLRQGELFPETEAFMIAIQDQVIDTKNYRKYIIRDSSLGSDHCRHCHKQSENIQHIIGACSSITQTDYKHRHDQVAAIIHQTLAYDHNLITEKLPYYKYTPQTILDSPKCKLYWDRTILTDKTIHHNRPDITFYNKTNKTVYLIDIAIPNTHNLSSTHTNKLSKYADLTIELKTQWKVQTVKTIPIIISSTGVIPKTIHTSLNTLKLHPLTYILLQKAVILNTCRIVRKFLSID